MFYKQIKINNPDDVQKKDIFNKLLVNCRHRVGEYMNELVLMTAGYVSVDFCSLIK